jgi:hypothetical protein
VFCLMRFIVRNIHCKLIILLYYAEITSKETGQSFITNSRLLLDNVNYQYYMWKGKKYYIVEKKRKMKKEKRWEIYRYSEPQLCE